MTCGWGQAATQDLDTSDDATRSLRPAEFTRRCATAGGDLPMKRHVSSRRQCGRSTPATRRQNAIILPFAHQHVPRLRRGATAGLSSSASASRR